MLFNEYYGSTMGENIRFLIKFDAAEQLSYLKGKQYLLLYSINTSVIVIHLVRLDEQTLILCLC